MIMVCATLVYNNSESQIRHQLLFRQRNNPRGIICCPVKVDLNSSMAPLVLHHRDMLGTTLWAAGGSWIM